MGIFSKIMGAIFGTSSAAASTPPAAQPEAPQMADAVKPMEMVDVTALLDKAVAAKKEKLDWRRSIVDLMKALDLDSSLAARKELAKELKYTGDTNDSAKMNMWLHKQMITRIAANGGKVPDDIRN